MNNENHSNFQRQSRVPASRATWVKARSATRKSLPKLRKAGQTNQVQRHGPSEHKKRTRPKVAEYKTGHDHHEKPKEEKLFFHTPGHPPSPLASSAGALGPAPTASEPQPL